MIQTIQAAPASARCTGSGGLVNDKIILLVEDNPGDEALARRALKKSNILNEVVVARDGAEALEYLFATGTYAGRDTRTMPGLILLDLKLPKVDGLEVLRRLRADHRTRCVPVVIMTTSQEEEDILTGYSEGANSFVCKPVDFQEFVATMQVLGHYWLVLNQAPPQRRGG